MSESGVSKVVIGWLHGGENARPRGEFVISMLALDRHSRDLIGANWGMLSGTNVSRVRNELAARFLLERREPWLLMLDSAMVFAPAALERLLAAAAQTTRPSLGGLCFTQEPNGDALSTM